MAPTRVEVRIRGNLGRLAGRLGLGLLFGLGLGALIGVPVVFLYGARYGVLVALALGPAIGSALSLRQLFHASSDVNAAVSPASTLHDDTMSAIVQTSMGCHWPRSGSRHRAIRNGPVRGEHRHRDRHRLRPGLWHHLRHRLPLLGLATPAFMTS